MVDNQVMEDHKKFLLLQETQAKLFFKKNSDYNCAYKEHGIVGCALTIRHKLDRLINLSKDTTEIKVDTEGLEDTLNDIAIWANMTLILMKDKGVK